MRYRFRCEYLGSAFYGWQEQNEAGTTKFITVQSELQKAFAISLRHEVRLVGSGRTDTGVSARGQCVHFDWEHEPFDLLKTEYSINGLTKRLIRIRELEPCAPDFHARHDAISRYYQYTIFTRPVALHRDFGWECGNTPLDLDLMEKEAAAFVGYHDFIGFCIPRHDGKITFCDLTEFRMERVNEYTIRFHIRGNRFLHRQVRAMVGTLFDIGRGRYPEGTICKIFAREFKGERMWAPSQGLILEDVVYPS